MSYMIRNIDFLLYLPINIWIESALFEANNKNHVAGGIMERYYQKKGFM